jgi:predicted GH43/DUF377 family glycosyl hydrolase
MRATTPADADRSWVGHADVELLARPDRVLARLFLPGQEPPVHGASRASGVVERCLALDEGEVRDTLQQVLDLHADRHRSLTDTLASHFAAVAHRVGDPQRLTRARRLLIGACFTQEYSVEGAALFNPSAVPHPRQDAPPGHLRFVVATRAVGEGHLSSIGFRTGVLGPSAGPDTAVTVDACSPFVTSGELRPTRVEAARLQQEARASGVDAESLDLVLGHLPGRFTLAQLDGALHLLHEQQLTRADEQDTARVLRQLAADRYEVAYDPDLDQSEYALVPRLECEARGVEDARLVRFVDDDGSVTYLATYTAFDGRQVAVRSLQSDDLRTFSSHPFTGPAATDKGMALFPRRVGGRLAALCRSDRESNFVSFSPDGYHWEDPTRLQTPAEPWELIQLGNCGPPLETEQGWLVLTHGVGPLRRYSIGALLLDLEDPTRVIGRLRRPLLTPASDERDGYVPNVAYSCGALLHDATLMIPYGCSDSRIRIALVDLPALLAALLAPAYEGNLR